MNVSPAVVLVSVAIGLPLMLLAIGVLYHAYLASRSEMQDALDSHVRGLATESTEDLLVSLQDAVDQMREQLAHQRQSLAGLLSDQRALLSGSPDGSLTLAAGEQVTQTSRLVGGRGGAVQPLAPVQLSRAAPRQGRGHDLRQQVLDLVSEGLSDRAIARELHVGLEEVRIARARGRS